MSLVVESPGLLSTLQDRGRHGYQHLGVSPGGAMDEVSHRLANLVVGNRVSTATLEITLVGPRLRFEADTLVALCGADLEPQMDGRPMPLWRPVLLRAGTCLRFGKAIQGARCYLAVEGGFALPAVMHSQSTHLAAGFGGFQGRALRAGDRLMFEPSPARIYPSLRASLSGEAAPFVTTPWFLPSFGGLGVLGPGVLRFMPGPEWSTLSEPSRGLMLETPFRLSSHSNRMGLRLEGPTLALDHPVEMLSGGVATGTIQLPPDGSPILLMADRQTTGGYPRIGDLASVDLPRAAQMRPGDTLRFSTLTLEEAQALYLRREARFRELEQVLMQRQRQ